MKKYIALKILILLVFSVRAQDLMGNFEEYDPLNCQWYTYGVDAFRKGCFGNNWKVSHGTPDGMADGEYPTYGNKYAVLYAGKVVTGVYTYYYASEGIYYTGYKFYPYNQYTLSFKIMVDAPVENTYIKLANGLPVKVSGTPEITSVPDVSQVQQIKELQNTNNTSWQTVTFTFHPDQEYNQLWFYTYSANENAIGTYLDDIQITSVSVVGDNGCCQPNINYTNNTANNPLPSFTKRNDYIKANTNVQVTSGNNVAFQAGNYILLEPGFETQSNATFFAYISPCSTNVPVTANAGPDISKQWGDWQCVTIGAINPTPDVGVVYSWSASVPAEAETWTFVGGPVHPNSYYAPSLSSSSIANPSVCPLAVDAMGMYVNYTLTVSSNCWVGSSTDVMRYTYYLCYPRTCPGAKIATQEDDLEEANYNTLTIFPNPSSGKFDIAVPSNVDNYRIIVKDMNGKMVYSGFSKEIQTTIDLERISLGMYFITIESDKGILNDKIIIQ